MPSRKEKGEVETPSSISQKLMKSLVLSKEGSVSMVDLPVPTPGHGQMLVKIEQAGICRTDLHMVEGKMDRVCPRKAQVILGHEGVGTIVSMGPGIENERGMTEFKLGDRVGLPWLGQSCRNCEYCVKGKETLCPFLKTTGCNINGTYAEYAVVSAPHAIVIPPSLTSAQAAPFLCAGVTAFTGLKRLKVGPNEWVGVLGAAGGVGHLAVQFAKSMGMKVVAIEHTADKVKFCKQTLNVDHAYNCSDATIDKALKDLTQFGLHHVFVAAPCEKAYQNAFEWVRPGGKICAAAICDANVQLPVQLLVCKKIKVFGTLTGTRQDMRETLQMAVDHKIACVLTAKPFKEGPLLLNAKELSKYAGRVVLDCSKSA